MALVAVNNNANDIGDIALQTKELDEQIREYQRGIQQIDREIGDTQKEKGLLETALMLSELQKNKLEVIDRLNASRPDPEVAARLQDLRNQLKLQHKKGVAGDQAKRTGYMQYEKKKGRLEELHLQLEETKAKTNWAQVSKGHQQDRDYLGQENKLRELKATIRRMEEEQAIQQQLTQKKTQMIDQLTKRKAKLEEAERQLEDLRYQIKDAENLKADNEDEMRTLNRIYMKKESLIKNLQKDTDMRDPKNIKALESDKKVLQYEITKHSEVRRANDKTIQAQHYRLRALESKLRAIAGSLKSLKKKDLEEEDIMKYRPNVADSTVEMVDSSLFTMSQEELEDARRMIEAKDSLMLKKDATIEVLERKVEILINAKDVLIKRLKRESSDKEREKKVIQERMEKEEEWHYDMKDQLLGLYMKN